MRMNRLWFAACFALGLTCSKLAKVIDQFGCSQAHAQTTSIYSEQEIMAMLDNNWEWWELRHWWFFPRYNLAIQQRPSKYETRKGTFQWLVTELRPRAMNGAADAVLYYLCISGRSDYEKKFKRRSAADRFEGVKFYSELNGFKVEEVIGGKDLLRVSSSRDLEVWRKVPFPIGKVPKTGAYSIPTDSGMIHRYKMSHYYKKDDLIFLHSPLVGDDSVAFHYIQGRDYWWDEFEPYKGYRGSKGSKSSSVQESNKKVKAATSKLSLRERILGEWRIIRSTLPNPPSITKMVFLSSGKVLTPEDETTPSFGYELHGNRLYFPLYNQSAWISFKGDTLIIKDVYNKKEYFTFLIKRR